MTYAQTSLSIAQMFYEIGWAEQKGTGIRAMQQAMAESGLPAPRFESDLRDRAFRVTFYRDHGIREGTPQITPQTTSNSKGELLRVLAEGKRISRLETEELILLLCAEHPQTARDLAAALHRSADYVRNAYLSRLVRDGRLRLTGASNDPHVAYLVSESSSAPRRD